MPSQPVACRCFIYYLRVYGTQPPGRGLAASSPSTSSSPRSRSSCTCSPTADGGKTVWNEFVPQNKTSSLLHAHYRAQRPIMGLWEFCTWLRVLIGADMLMATVQGLSGQVAGASPTRGKPYCGTCL